MHNEPVSQSLRRTLAWISTVAATGCSGILKEQPGGQDLDAPIHATIPPPPCDPPGQPADSGDCTGGGMPGDDCLMCHQQGNSTLPFTFAGTVFDAPGTTPAGGATSYLQDDLGNVATAVAHPGNGNFYAADGFVTFPAKVFVSLCPDVLEMISPVQPDVGANCNSAGCHTAGFRIHVP